MTTTAASRQARFVCENRGVDNFAVVICEEPEGGFWAEVPALPGCYSQGESIEELMRNVRESIRVVLDVMKEDGDVGIEP